MFNRTRFQLVEKVVFDKLAYCREMYDLLIEQMKEKEGVTEKLKEKNQFEWVQRMDKIQQIAREIVCNDLLYV